MKLVPLGNNEFPMLSFPIKLSFQIYNNKKVMHVTGTYDWKEIMGRTMWEILYFLINSVDLLLEIVNNTDD